MDEDAKYLDNDEVLTLELNHEKAKVNKLEIEKLELKKQLLVKDKQILELKFKILDNEYLGHDRSKVELKTKDKARQDNHKEWISWIKQKYELDEDWGFDPDSGEIKQK